MLWIGEHLSEDSSQPRHMGLTHRDGAGVVTMPGDFGDYWFEEVYRSPASWGEYDSASGNATYVDGTPFFYEYENYADIVAGWIKNSQGVHRLVVGYVSVLEMKVVAPVDGTTEFVMERFYPVKRFYSEAQAQGYVEDFAQLSFQFPDPGSGSLLLLDPTDGTSDCSVWTDPIMQDFCACLNTAAINFNAAIARCATAPSIGDIFQNGAIGAAGGAFLGNGISRVAKRVTGFWGTVAGGVGGFIGGASATYGYQHRDCLIRAKSTRDAAYAHAENEYNRVKDGNNGSYQCPIDAE